MNTAVRVVLADDHPMFRDGLGAILANAADIDVAGEAADGQQLLDLVERELPDLVLTDLAMPVLDGAAAISTLLDRHPTIGVLVLTMHDDDQALFAALRAGARGYLLKDADRDDIIRGVLAVAAGEVLYGASVARRLVLSEKTVRNHVAAILTKLQSPDRAAAVARARDAGIGTRP